jgi:hypothetical protein
VKPSTVDPRDVALHVSPTAWRVYFSLQADDSPMHVDEHRITDEPDVLAVAAWAATEARGRDVVLYAEVPTRDGLMLVQLRGDAPG